jgi:hypothetical protein
VIGDNLFYIMRALLNIQARINPSKYKEERDVKSTTLSLFGNLAKLTFK